MVQAQFTTSDVNSPNYIGCFYIVDISSTNLNRKIIDVHEQVYSSTTLVTQPNIDSSVLDLFSSNNTIIINYPGAINTKFIVGIPNRNGNNISKKTIVTAIYSYNINLLRSIIPYVKLAGNDYSVPFDVNDCISAKERKEIVLQYQNIGNVNRMTSHQAKTIIDRLKLYNSRVCLRTLNYF